MSIKVLVSTMNNSNPKNLLGKMNVSSDAIIINQCQFNKLDSFEINGNQITYVCCDEKGLSKSRNKAILSADESDICLLADDDLVYVQNYKELVGKAFVENPTYDILAFQVEGIDRFFKSYPQKSKQLGYLSSLKVSSVEIAFKAKKLKKKNINFNELFGSGAYYKMGEENLFLHDCLRKGLKIKYIPIKVADLYMGDSTWFKGFTYEYFVDRGAVFAAMSKGYSRFLIMQFALRKYKLYKNETSLKDAIKSMFYGRKQYFKKISGESL
ncbi:glycosyltransferase family A protein [Priestia megaterium]|uniref:glycosyltransferase family A protein n=1 Tax=Priestia megaterium TaxID=1404 RepID=UPI00207AFD72|nr:glycosyltransferase family A protein [Priestia megaterium]USL25724.1 glycosyltransferase family 2 protein [Priestia megaterium]